MGRITERVRTMRKNQTPAEALMWQQLRGRKLAGYKFLRQHPIFNGKPVRGSKPYFIPDFYCAAKKLIIEVDGSIHETQQGYDTWREKKLINLGMTVLRFKNEELQDMDRVLGAIRAALEA